MAYTFKRKTTEIQTTKNTTTVKHLNSAELPSQDLGCSASNKFLKKKI